jgi:hypothetical protein
MVRDAGNIDIFKLQPPPLSKKKHTREASNKHKYMQVCERFNN